MSAEYKYECYANCTYVTSNMLILTEVDKTLLSERPKAINEHLEQIFRQSICLVNIENAAHNYRKPDKFVLFRLI